MNSIKNLDLLGRIINTQSQLSHKVFTFPGEINIIYIEGMNPDGTVNDDRMNEWNDLRIVYSFVDNTPKLLGMWKATTEPGWKYTLSPMNPSGAFRIAFGHYQAWRVGWHKDHEALIQVGEIKGHRDKNKDGYRTGDSVVTGLFGVNQHHGWDMAQVNGASAGCLVGQSIAGHKQFMEIVKQDVRYQKDKGYVFWTAVLDGSKLGIQ